MGWALCGIFGANERFVAGFLAVDYVIGGLDAHEQLDASVGAVEIIGGGFPDEVAVVGYAKDVEGRDHGRRVYTTNAKLWMYSVGQAGIGMNHGCSGSSVPSWGRSMLRPYGV
jgi:hypothetical protein